MNSPAVSVRTPGHLQIFFDAAPFLVFVGLTIAIIAPRGVMAGLIVLAVLPIIALARSQRLNCFSGIDRLLVGSVIAFGIYIAINATWSADRLEAIGKVACYWFLGALVAAAVAGLRDLDTRTLTRVAWALAAAVAVSAVFLVIEARFNEPIQRFIYSIVAGSRAASKHVRVVDGWVSDIAAYVLNRNIAVLNFAVWPALLIVTALMPRRRALIAGGALWIVVALATFSSEHQTSMISWVFASVVLAGMLVLPGIVRRLVLLGWVAAVVLVVPIALASYSAGLHLMEAIPETGRNRIILWGYTAQQVPKAPILGTGVSSTKTLDDKVADTAVWPDGFTYPLRTGRHAHNIFMQTWYELGAIGAGFLLVVGLAILRLLERQPAHVQPFAYASFVSAVILGAFSWGMWQSWFMAAFGLWALLLVCAVEIARNRPAG